MSASHWHYKWRITILYPPFSYFVDFPQEMSKIRNTSNPGFQYKGSPNVNGPVQKQTTKSTTVLTCKTEVEPNKYTTP